MRLKTVDLATIYLRQPINGQDDEGNVITRPLTPDFVATKIGRA